MYIRCITFNTHSITNLHPCWTRIQSSKGNGMSEQPNLNLTLHVCCQVEISKSRVLDKTMNNNNYYLVITSFWWVQVTVRVTRFPLGRFLPLSWALGKRFQFLWPKNNNQQLTQHNYTCLWWEEQLPPHLLKFLFAFIIITARFHCNALSLALSITFFRLSHLHASASKDSSTQSDGKRRKGTWVLWMLQGTLGRFHRRTLGSFRRFRRFNPNPKNDIRMIFMSRE